MKTEEPVEIDRGIRCCEGRPRHRDRGTQPVIRLLTERHDDVERVGGAALKETDQDLAASVAQRASASQQILRVDRATQQCGIQSHRHERERSVLHEDTSLHGPISSGIQASTASPRPSG